MPHSRHFPRPLSRRGNALTNAPNNQEPRPPANRSTQNDAEADRVFEGTHYHTLLPPFPEDDTTDTDPPASWSPPNPYEVMETPEGVDCLQTFQNLPGEAQIRVIYLHQQEGVTVQEAVATVSTEHRLRLLEQPVQAREAHTAAVRLMVQHVNESIFTKWILLTVLIQALPARQQETGRQILRLVSADPRDLKGVYSARRLAGRLGNSFINRALDDINNYGSSFRRHDEDLRGLSRYDRRNPFPEPDPVDGPPESMSGPEKILAYERILEASTQTMGQALGGYCMELNEWLDGVCTTFAEADDPVLQKLAQLHASWNQGVRVTVEKRKRQLLCYPFDKSAWNDPATTDPGAILLGGFFKCALVRRGHPSLFHLGLIADWQDWDLRKPDIAAKRASDKLMAMHSAAREHLKDMQQALHGEVTALGSRVTPGLHKALLTALKCYDFRHINVLRSTNAREISRWPLEVQCRLYTISKLHSAIAKLWRLEATTQLLAKSLGQFDAFMSAPRDMPKAMFKLYARARRVSFPAWHLNVFKTYHQAAIDELADLVSSCRNARAKKLMLAAFPPASSPSSSSPAAVDLQRIRDIAVAAQAGPSLIKSADMLLWQQRDMATLTRHIHALQQHHATFLASLTIHHAAQILAYESSPLPPHPANKRLVATQAAPWSTMPLVERALGCPDFAPALRAVLSAPDAADMAPGAAVDVARGFWTAALQRRLGGAVAMLRGGEDGEDGEDHGAVFVDEHDAMLVARLLLRAVYHNYIQLPNTALTQAQGLARHCWVHGLLGAWEAWRAAAARLVRKVVRVVAGSLASDRPRGWDLWTFPEAGLVEMLACACERPEHPQQQNYWDEVEARLAADENDVLPLRTKDQFFEHLHKLRLLREATRLYLRLPDEVDPRVLPEDFRGAEEGGGEDGGLDLLYRMVRFEGGSVLDGGSLVVDATGWEDAHEYQLRQMGLEHLSRSRRDVA